MSILYEQQNAFARALPLLINEAFAMGFEVTLGDLYRSPLAFGKFGQKKCYGTANSKHKLRLAIDLNLFRDGKYLMKSEEYAALGAYWKSIGGLWGGDFVGLSGQPTPDGNHFEWPL